VGSTLTPDPNAAVGGLPLDASAHGEAVRDLQRRLAACGFDIDQSELGTFGPSTTGAVHRFQESRGLLLAVVCDASTWAALVEAGYRLGDRLLYHRTPMLRGDDVSELQLRLGALGFDAGRVDGIFGPRAEQALKDFQRNAGLTTDGVCGRDVLAALDRLGGHDQNAPSVAGVREREALRDAPRVLASRRIAIGTAGGLDVVSAALRRALQDTGAVVVELTHPDPSVQAAEANRFAAEVFVGLGADERGPCRTAFYGTTGFVSAGGQRLAEVVTESLERRAGLTTEAPRPMRLPLLRETRMPAVMCYLGPTDALVEASTTVGDALATAVARWAAEPVEN
jgi:N-acetylmuramoyl-L-alanine amidase